MNPFSRRSLLKSRNRLGIGHTTSPATPRYDHNDTSVGQVAASLAPVGSSEASVPSAPQSASATTATKLRLEINATDKCWISVDRDGKPVLRKILQPGEVQSFDAEEKFQLVLGNAGAVRLRINGKSAKPLGKRGEVLKVLIDGNNLQNILDQTAG